MINFEDAIIRKMILHRVESEALILNKNQFYHANETEENALKRILLKTFATQAITYAFGHDVDLEYNVAYKTAKQIFAVDDFVEMSHDLATHLQSVSKHPNINDGDVLVALFDQVMLEGNYYKALGIYKFEDKELFLETQTEGNQMKTKFTKVIGAKKPEKACLILCTDPPFTVLDFEGRKDTEYWHHEFLNLVPKQDHVNDTNNFLTMTRRYIISEMPHDFEVEKADQIDLMNRSVAYFKTHDTFNKEEFAEEVIQHQTVIDSFDNFANQFHGELGTEQTEEFPISKQAVKKQSRVYKSVLKLDKNFHVYIHGDRNKIEKGTEVDGRKFYKIYYEEEL